MVLTHHLFCFGFGYTASRLADALASKAWRISGTTRSEHKSKSEAANSRLLYRLEDITTDWVATYGKEITHMLHSIPPGALGDPILPMMNFWKACFPNLEWFGYLSTTGVYGNHEGAWVDEASNLHPTNDRSIARVDAENTWLELARTSSLPLHIFRLSGIYGPGRSVFDAIEAGTARRVNQPDRLFSRIHVDDIVQVLEASMAKPNPGSIYNLADDLPETQANVVAYACELLHHPLPLLIELDDPSLSEMARSFYAGNRKVKNTKIKEELGVRLRYPTYREGLRSIRTTLQTS